MIQPLFSVLIANYNNGKYLMDAIESVRQQTYPHWEIVLVDDASTDNSEELYAELEKDERIHIYRNEQNMGCGYTKRRCAEMAKGEFCGFLDPDDVLLPNALHVTVDALEKHPQAVLTISRYYRCDNEMNIVSESRLLKLRPKESYLEHHDYQPEVFSGWRREAYVQTGGLDETYKAGVDQDLYFRLEEQGEIYVIDEFTYKYRSNESALTSTPYWCYYWNIIARHAACIRRGLPVKELSYADFLQIVTENEQYAREQVEKMQQSKAYRLGKALLKPFKWMRRNKKLKQIR